MLVEVAPRHPWLCSALAAPAARHVNRTYTRTVQHALAASHGKGTERERLGNPQRKPRTKHGAVPSAGYFLERSTARARMRARTRSLASLVLLQTKPGTNNPAVHFLVRPARRSCPSGFRAPDESDSGVVFACSARRTRLLLHPAPPGGTGRRPLPRRPHRCRKKALFPRVASASAPRPRSPLVATTARNARARASQGAHHSARRLCDARTQQRSAAGNASAHAERTQLGEAYRNCLALLGGSDDGPRVTMRVNGSAVARAQKTLRK